MKKIYNKNCGFSFSLFVLMFGLAIGSMMYFLNNNYNNIKEGFIQNDIDEILVNIRELSKAVEENKEINTDDKKELLKMINADQYSIFSSYNLLSVEIKNNNGTINKSFLNNFKHILHGEFEKKINSIVIDPKYKTRIGMFIERIDGNIRLLFNGCKEWSHECR
jgi:Na+/melibiose symporter-like transporter